MAVEAAALVEAVEAAVVVLEAVVVAEAGASVVEAVEEAASEEVVLVEVLEASVDRHQDLITDHQGDRLLLRRDSEERQ